MKRAATCLVLLAAIAAGAAHWLDLVNFTDLATGFSSYGPLWARYAVAGAVAALCALASLLAARRPVGLWQRSIAQGLVSLLCAAGFAVLGGIGLLRAVQQDLTALIQQVLWLFTALWMLLLAVARLSARSGLPSSSAVWGVAGTVSLYLLTVVRFIFKPSGIVRVAPTIQVFSALAALLFSTALLKSAYLPRANCGRWLSLTGSLAFFLCTCLELPQTLCLYLVSAADRDELLLSGCLGLLGLLGAVCALIAAGPCAPEPEAEAPAKG